MRHKQLLRCRPAWASKQPRGDTRSAWKVPGQVRMSSRQTRRLSAPPARHTMPRRMTRRSVSPEPVVLSATIHLQVRKRHSASRAPGRGGRRTRTGAHLVKLVRPWATMERPRLAISASWTSARA